MLLTTLTPHREYLLAQSSGQKLFLTLALRPDAQAEAARAQLCVVFVVDTSGSMREVVTEPTEYTGETTLLDGKRYEVVRGAKSKMDVVEEALLGVLEGNALGPEDRLALVKFDDHAEVLLPFTPLRERANLRGAVEHLKSFSGGTQMGAGMELALELLGREGGSRRMVLLTDGQTFDEELARSVGEALAQDQIPVTAIGVGEDWNETLLTELTDRTQGKPFYVVPSAHAEPPAVGLAQLPHELLTDLAHSASEVVTNVNLSVKTVREVTLERVTRVYPTQNEVDRGAQPFFLGNAEAGNETLFVLEFSLPARPPARMRLAQLGLTYQVPGADFRGELPPLDVVVEFTAEESLAGRIDPAVMRWVQQRNLEGLIAQATRQAERDPAGAQKTMELARAMTVKLGNGVMTQALDRAIGELKDGKTVSLGTAKTLKIGAKTQTLRGGEQSLPSDEEIRKLTGA